MKASREQLFPGAVVWANLDPVVGREQSGHRPHIVVSTQAFNSLGSPLIHTVPITRRNRGWDNHVSVEMAQGQLDHSFALTEQVRALSIDRITGFHGAVTATTLKEIRWWLHRFLVFDIGGVNPQ